MYQENHLGHVEYIDGLQDEKENLRLNVKKV